MNIIKNAKKTLLPLVICGLFAGNVMAAQTPVNLGVAGDFTILSKTGITDVYPSNVTGSVGTSPITGAALLLECDEINIDAPNVNVYTVDAAGPSCKTTDAQKLSTAIGDMETAYRDAAERVSPDKTELGAGEIGGKTLAPGLYKWSSTVSISTDVILNGNANDVWIFQIAGGLLQASSKSVTLTGGAVAKNVFWQVAGGVTIGTGASFQGVILSKTLIAVKTDASVNGRLLAQTAVTLQMNTVTAPATECQTQGCN